MTKPVEPSAPRKFRKKPVEVEAIQWTGHNVTEVLDFAMTGEQPLWGDDFTVDTGEGLVRILTLEGKMCGHPGDWIIRGVTGEFYPCKPVIFEATYEPV